MAAGRISARHIWLGPGRWLSPGTIAWDARGIVRELGPAHGRVADIALFPGLVDAHAHLQLAALPQRPGTFLQWVRAVMRHRLATADAALVRQGIASLRELLRDGTTAVGEIDSTGLGPRILARVPLAGRCYQEVTGFHLDAVGARALLRARMRRCTGPCPAGLSPHAPYSVSPALFAAAAARARHLAIHVAEVPEEQAFLRRGDGPFAELLRDLGRLAPDHRAPGVGAVRWLEQLGLLRPTTLLVHCQELERGDAARIAAAGAPIVVCPGTIDYFRRSPPPVGTWLRAGMGVALGTDSRASNTGLSMRGELRRAARLWPGLGPEQLLTMATAAGGRALGRPGLGRLRRGGRADLFGVAVGAHTRRDLLEQLVHGALPTRLVRLGGRRVRGVAR